MRKLSILAAIMAMVCGCDKSTQTQTSADASVQTEAIEAAEAPASCRTTPSATADRDTWTAANNNFGFEMLRAVPATDSVVFSPYSVERAMGMLLDGACGKTAAEIMTALRLPDAGNNSQIGAEIEAEMLKTNGEQHTIDIDNHLWIEQTYALRDDYLEKMTQAYTAKPEFVNFSGAPNEARTKINDFIAQVTHDKIQNILPAEAVTALTRVILTNAVYFKGPWRNNFNEKLTDKADFRTDAGTVQVDMMHHTARHAAYIDDAVTAFDMDFAEANYALMIVMPNVAADETKLSTALDNLTSKLDAASFKAMREKMSPTQVALNMPKFRIEYGASLKDLLRKLGVSAAFSSPDFSAMTDNRDLYLSDVLHKAFIDVNENGAEAAAATAVVMKLRAAIPQKDPLVITVDHPFAFAIVEKSTQTTLFAGRVTKI